jgi:hypothetical protein
MSTLPTPLRRQLEAACKEARTIASIGARKALEALAVHEPSPYGHMDEVQCKLRDRLQAQAKQLGDGECPTRPGSGEIKHLVEKLAYDQWHRLLFARFLLENNLLISPEHQVSVSLDDCEELAPSLGLKDAWAVAARFAAKELPQIFRADDSAGAVELPVEDRNPITQLVTGLPVEVFTASDSLGWCYQFWQSERKDEVNAAGNKIGADELPAVTQLFTEDYMVDFLLDNTFGAWHAGKVLALQPTLAETAQSEEELRSAVALPGCSWKYLRFVKGEDGKWRPAAGTFDGWPKSARELKCLDPCMGSGHFVVAMFERMVALRMADEELDEMTAVAAVIRDNLFGLEIDQRCTQIGAFNLALAAWRRVGHSTLPAMNLACSGLAPNAKEADWLKLAGDDDRLQRGMAQLHALFKDAPVLGSLIDPRNTEGDLLIAAFHELQPLLERALSQETKDETAHEIAVTAQGLAKAAEILTGEYTLAITNVPYLVAQNQCDTLRDWASKNANDAKGDLAYMFVSRMLKWLAKHGSAAVVAPQNWLFQTSSRKFRERLLKNEKLNIVARLGPGAFETIGGHVVNVAMIIISNELPKDYGIFSGLDVTNAETPLQKSLYLQGNAPAFTDELEATSSNSIMLVAQAEQLKTPDSRITLTPPSTLQTLETLVNCRLGLGTGDASHYIRRFWESARIDGHWDFFQNTSEGLTAIGYDSVVAWDSELKRVYGMSAAERRQAHNQDYRGREVWGKRGVSISIMSSLRACDYSGQLFDKLVATIVPKDSSHLPALSAYLHSPTFPQDVRKLDQKVSVTNATLIKVPFDLPHWQKIAAEQYPHGLPKPFSSDPTQWLFNGHPKDSDQPLHIAATRLLGYQWPRQTGSGFPDCPALDQDGLEKFADKDGIVCLSATMGEAPAAERLRAVLVQALGKFDVSALIASAGPKGSKSETLEDWLRDEFFEQHCALFQNRPFIWHIWDGHKSGFSALVNYHKLTYGNLETLTYAYLGDWIRRQQAAVEGGESGSDARLQAAKQLQARLRRILKGEPPYDLFVRWKPLSEQTIGWHRDVNDGVRINIRPFATADILRKRVKIKWDKDRGKEPVRDKKDFPWFWGWDEETHDFAGVGDEPDGNRWNGCHYTNEFKLKSRKG